jgi:hypothetical protein
MTQNRLDGIIKKIIESMENSFEDDPEIIQKTKEKLLFLKLFNQGRVTNIGDVARMVRRGTDLDKLFEYVKEDIK